MKLKLTIPVSLLILFIISACELPRPGGDVGDISPDIPVVTGPEATASPTVTEAAVPPTETAEMPPSPSPEGVTPPDIPDISPEGVPAAVAPDVQEFVPGQVLLKLTQQAAIQAQSAELGTDGIMKAGIPSLDQTLKQIGANRLEPIIEEVANVVGKAIQPFSVQALGVSQLYSVNFSPDHNPLDIANLLRQDPTVEYAEPNYLAGITVEPGSMPAPVTPNDPYFKFQWHLEAIQMSTAWESSTGAGVTVAIVDTGVDFGTPDLANVNRLTGYDFTNNDSDPTDDQGHGTHVAGTIAQSTNNGLGVAGVAFDARLLPVKVLGSNGQGSYEDIIKGIIYAVDQGAKVINLSLAGRGGSQALQEAVKYAHSKGVVVVAAAGNSSGPVEYPAAYDDFVIAVGATRYDNTLAPYSNFGAEIDLVAPGGDIDVDQNQDGWADGVLQQTFKSSGTGYSYRFFEGTSMASPHVAGVAALMLSRKPNASPAEIEAIMAQTARNLGSVDQFGAGLIQAANALAAIGGPLPITVTPIVQEPTLTPTPTPTPSPSPTSTPILPAPPTFTPTPTLTPIPPIPTTPTPPPLPGELLVNASFEGDDGWVFGDTPIRGGYDTGIVRSGSRSARVGATSGRDTFSFSSVWQRVTIPVEAGQVTLSAYVYPISQDGPGTDVQNIMILNQNFRVLRTLSTELSNSQSWELRSYDLSDLRGQTIYVYFSVLNRGRTGRLSAMYIDDVSLSWGP